MTSHQCFWCLSECHVTMLLKWKIECFQRTDTIIITIYIYIIGNSVFMGTTFRDSDNEKSMHRTCRNSFDKAMLRVCGTKLLAWHAKELCFVHNSFVNSAEKMFSPWYGNSGITRTKNKCRSNTHICYGHKASYQVCLNSNE